MNPFKFGTIVKDNFFTDRTVELEQVKQMLDSENHLVIISPRRFGKSSLIAKAVEQIGRPSITIDMMKVLSVEDFAAHIVRGIFRLHRIEKVKHLMTHFRIIPTISYNPMTDAMDVSFSPSIDSPTVALEDAMEMLERVSHEHERMIVVLDEFQEIDEIDKSLSRQLRAILQRQTQINYVFMGSQESMMNDIFEKKKSPFYHFGQRMNLHKIPYQDFFNYITLRLPDIPAGTSITKESVADDILRFTRVHPYYTQQLSSIVYGKMQYEGVTEHVVELSIKQQMQDHDLDYERLWASLKRTDRFILMTLAKGGNPLTERRIATSTAFSSLKRLTKQGYVIKLEHYELEDPFFGQWILRNNF